jgi:hypothetical protein
LGNKEWKKNHDFDSCVVATMVSKIQYKQLVLGFIWMSKWGPNGGKKGWSLSRSILLLLLPISDWLMFNIKIAIFQLYSWPEQVYRSGN